MRSAARTARSASSSWATGAPNSASMPSPRILSTLPPNDVTSSTSRSKQESISRLTCSGSRCSARVGEADQIGEEHRDDPPFLGLGCGDGMPAGRAEPGICRELGGAGRTQHQPWSVGHVHPGRTAVFPCRWLACGANASTASDPLAHGHPPTGRLIRCWPAVWPCVAAPRALRWPMRPIVDPGDASGAILRARRVAAAGRPPPVHVCGADGHVRPPSWRWRPGNQTGPGWMGVLIGAYTLGAYRSGRVLWRVSVTRSWCSVFAFVGIGCCRATRRGRRSSSTALVFAGGDRARRQHAPAPRATRPSRRTRRTCRT